MIARAAALAVCCLLFETGASKAPASSTRAQWLAANERAIARIHDPHKRGALRSRFLLTQRELNSKPQAALHSAPDAQRLAAAILSNHRVFAFGLVQKPPPKTWWERLNDWFSERWSAAMKALFSRVHVSGQTSIAIGDVLLVLSIVAFLAFVGRLMWIYGPSSNPADLRSHALAAPEDPALLYARAVDAAQRGDFRSGIALLFAASLLALHVRSALHEDAAKTIGELRRNVRRTHPQCVSAFDRLANILTVAIYAEAAVDLKDWDAAVAAYEALQAESRNHAA